MHDKGAHHRRIVESEKNKMSLRIENTYFQLFYYMQQMGCKDVYRLCSIYWKKLNIFQLNPNFNNFAYVKLLKLFVIKRDFVCVLK